MRISIGDLIAGVGAATKTFAPGGKHPQHCPGQKLAVYDIAAHSFFDWRSRS